MTTDKPEEGQPHPADDSLTPVPDELFEAEFAAWWKECGQLCRSGGGEYECSFAFEAWRHLYPWILNLQVAAAEREARIAELGHTMREAVDYLDSNKLNSIGYGSKLHRFMQDALAKH